MFPKIVGFPPNHPFLIGFSIIFTIHFGVFSPYFWKHPYPTTKFFQYPFLSVFAQVCVFLGQVFLAGTVLGALSAWELVLKCCKK